MPRLLFTFRAPALFVVGSRPYYATALQFATGLDVTALSPRHTPGYSAFLVGVIDVFGIEPLAIAAVQHAIGVGSAILCYFLGKLVAGRLVGLAAGLITGLNGTLIAYEHHILTETMFAFLLLLAIVLIVLAARRGFGWLFVLGGFVIGAAALTRPIGQTLALAAPPALWLHFRKPRPTVVACLLLGAGFLLAAGPWVLRNALTQSEPDIRHPGSTLLGHIMHERPFTRGFFTLDSSDPDPLHREARRIVERMAPDEPDPLEMWTELQQRLGISPAQANKLMMDLALDTLRRYPWHYTQVFSGKCFNLLAEPRDEKLEDFLGRTKSQWPGRFLSGPIKDGRLPDLNPSDITAAQQWEIGRASAIVDFFRPALFAPALAVLFVVGLVAGLLRPDRRLALLPALAVLGIIVLNGIIAGDKPRYRYPLDPLIGVVAMAGLAASVEALGIVLRRSRGSHRSRQASATAG